MRIERAALAALILAAAAGCRERPLPSVGPGRMVRARADAARSLRALVPDHARAGEVFQAQPNGQAGLALLGTGFTRRDVVSWGGRPLATTFGSSRLLTAKVPPEWLARPGAIEVTVEEPSPEGGARLRAIFQVEPSVPAAAPLYKN